MNSSHRPEFALKYHRGMYASQGPSTRAIIQTALSRKIYCLRLSTKYGKCNSRSMHSKDIASRGTQQWGTSGYSRLCSEITFTWDQTGSVLFAVGFSAFTLYLYTVIKIM